MPIISTVNHISKTLFDWARIDRAIFYALLSRFWALASGPVILLLITRYFSPEIQGFHYTFASLLALTSFFELGFSTVITNVASHEWGHLQMDRNGNINGNAAALSRLISLGRLVFKWYAAISITFVIVVSIAGYIFFARHPYNGINWQGPWFVLVILTGLTLFILPFKALLEGCNQIAMINQLRFTQTVMGSTAICLAIILNAGLWASAVYASISLLRDLYMLLVQYRRFFQPFLHQPNGPDINWRSEIWPMQWRLAVSGIVGYFAFSLYTPVMFHYHGAVVAGQMGMTIQFITLIQGMSLTWIYTKVPHFGMLVSKKDYATLDRDWMRSSIVSMVVVTVGSMAVLLTIYGLNMMEVSLMQRILAPIPTGVFLLSKIIMTIGHCESVYLRAHKQEPIFISGVTHAVIIGLLVWQLGSRLGPIGAVLGDLIGIIIGTVWTTLIWQRCRKEWHS